MDRRSRCPIRLPHSVRRTDLMGLTEMVERLVPPAVVEQEPPELGPERLLVRVTRVQQPVE